MFVRRAFLYAGLAVVVIAASACSESGGGKTTAPSKATMTAPSAVAVPSTVSPSAVPSADGGSWGPAADAALDAYRRMWASVVEASKTSDFESPTLAQYASGQALQLLTAGMAQSRKDGIVTRGEPALGPKVVAAGPTQVEIVDCADATRWLQYRADGQLKDNVPGGRHHTEATVVVIGGVWKVARLSVGPVGSC